MGRSKYLLKISSAGNRFLIADNRWFQNPPPPDWSDFTFKTRLDFLSFLNIAKLSLLERENIYRKVDLS